VKASKIFAEGLQGISKEVAASNKASIEHSVSFTKSLLGVKSIKEAVDLQSSFARSSIEKAVSETNKGYRCLRQAGGTGDRAVDRAVIDRRREVRQSRRIALLPAIAGRSAFKSGPII